jgi:hypothetical protein
VPPVPTVVVAGRHRRRPGVRAVSLAFRHAAALYATLRADYEDLRMSAYLAAEEATRGALMNRLGHRRGIDPYSLFMGTEARAQCYASDELREWWRDHPRVTFADFERQMLGE